MGVNERNGSENTEYTVRKLLHFRRLYESEPLLNSTLRQASTQTTQRQYGLHVIGLRDLNRWCFHFARSIARSKTLPTF